MIPLPPIRHPLQMLLTLSRSVQRALPVPRMRQLTGVPPVQPPTTLDTAAASPTCSSKSANQPTRSLISTNKSFFGAGSAPSANNLTDPPQGTFSKCKKLNSNFSVLYFNARSLLPKVDCLRTVATVHSPDCICIVETWLNGDIFDSELCIEGYDIIRLDRNRHGGGVLIYVSSTYSHNVLYSGSPELELIIVSICTTVPIIIALFYRPPSSTYSILDNLLTVLCTHVRASFSHNLILLGDFNINFLNNSHPLFTKLLIVTSSLSLSQIVSELTHLSPTLNSLIDLVFLSSPENLSSCVTLPPLANSDHLGVSFSIKNCKSTLTSVRKARKVWRYAYANFDMAHEMISEIDWDSVFSSKDIDVCWANWQSIFLFPTLF